MYQLLQQEYLFQKQIVILVVIEPAFKCLKWILEEIFGKLFLLTLINLWNLHLSFGRKTFFKTCRRFNSVWCSALEKDQDKFGRTPLPNYKDQRNICKLWTKFIALNINGVIVSGLKINLYLCIQLAHSCFPLTMRWIFILQRVIFYMDSKFDLWF